ncbi:hypothetical protein G6F70_005022 [Rhizopus microsporus]|uniref:Tc1-like transposase DDE domain-containing protein n=1 Tax=Rhizopus microsporus TaxID=58291 RepID=A0A1X0RWW3_RHIZD|nr:hypothetical protein G6F71_004597 [Rhizopus microsporus]KAG1199319.1 hypothetical protein G6F70_005022 [Rhizopus microsporus]KAG1211133.1 hypothetical protein G6F69_004849 [Rhizopus microsporus]ORE16545.1 hypothetical protein BCV71DRAFT_265559 [Rhizopus microsporus]
MYALLWHEQSYQIKSFDNWPSHGSDLNPIEHLQWALKQRVRKRRHQIHNVEQLEGVLHDEWKIFPLELAEKLVADMPPGTRQLLMLKEGIQSINNNFTI